MDLFKPVKSKMTLLIVKLTTLTYSVDIPSHTEHNAKTNRQKQITRWLFATFQGKLIVKSTILLINASRPNPSHGKIIKVGVQFELYYHLN
jgi:hypothetical protein